MKVGWNGKLGGSCCIMWSVGFILLPFYFVLLRLQDSFKKKERQTDLKDNRWQKKADRYKDFSHVHISKTSLQKCIKRHQTKATQKIQKAWNLTSFEISHWKASSI